MAELDRIYELMKDGFDGVHSRLDDLNGRTRESERKIAVLEDRGVRATDSGARKLAGAVGAVGILAEVIRQWVGSK